MNDKILSPETVTEALSRIQHFIIRTPIAESSVLNDLLGHKIIFKLDALQKTGAFKVRGVLNALLTLKEQNNLPNEIVAFSSGNHGQAIARACKHLNIKSYIYLPANTCAMKRAATASHGANVIVTKSRAEAEERVYERIDKGAYFLPPSNNDMVIAGAGTACLEALQDSGPVDAIFAPCGGGGLISGTWLAAQVECKTAKVFAAEPLIANDAALSLKSGEIYRFNDSPNTIADGARTLSITPRIFSYLKKLDGIFEITEEEIIYWTMWLLHLLKVNCEPTSALGMAAATRWLKQQEKPKKVLVILSGGNVDYNTYHHIWQKNYLTLPPNLQIDETLSAACVMTAKNNSYKSSL